MPPAVKNMWIARLATHGVVTENAFPSATSADDVYRILAAHAQNNSTNNRISRWLSSRIRGVDAEAVRQSLLTGRFTVVELPDLYDPTPTLPAANPWAATEDY